MKFTTVLGILLFSIGLIQSVSGIAWAQDSQIGITLKQDASGNPLVTFKPVFDNEWTIDLQAQVTRIPDEWKTLYLLFALGSIAEPQAPAFCQAVPYGQSSYSSEWSIDFTMHLLVQGQGCEAYARSLVTASSIQVLYTGVRTGVGDDLGNVLVELKR